MTGASGIGGTAVLHSAGPARVMLSRLAAGVRGSVTVVAGICAVVGLAAPVSPVWLAAALALLACWTAVYVWSVWTGGLRAWHVGVDLAVATGLCLAVRKLVPDAALDGGTSWVSNSASMTVICAQAAGRPVLSVPAGVLVAGSFVAGERMADASDGGTVTGITMALQAILAAVAAVVVLRAGHVAADAFADLQEANRRGEIGRAARADELAQLRLLHNGPLTTLTMAVHADQRRPSELLRRRAAVNLETLPRLAAEVLEDRMSDVRLDERLAQVMLSYEPSVKVSPCLTACSVPAQVGDAFVTAVGEALENVARHSQVDRAAVELREVAGLVVVTVRDHGRGFDPDTVPDHRFGIRQGICGAMSGVGGTAVLRSAPGEGTEIRLEWRRD